MTGRGRPRGRGRGQPRGAGAPQISATPAKPARGRGGQRGRNPRKRRASMMEEQSAAQEAMDIAVADPNVKARAGGYVDLDKPVEDVPALPWMWVPGGMNRFTGTQASGMPAVIKKRKIENVEVDDVEDEDIYIACTYADYIPSKLDFGKPHPDPVVETASLSSVEFPDITYRVAIPDSIIEECKLSALQLEAITYACQQHDRMLPDGYRAGFLVGDGAGVGKGRTIAGMIFENKLKGRKKAVWVSVSNDLLFDAQRDLNDIGASDIELVSLTKLGYNKINMKRGVLFSTYSALIGHSARSKDNGKSRVSQIVEWCGKDFDGLIVFDECHKAKNLIPSGSAKPTKTGIAVVELQERLPKARVLYASATGATEPKNMAYMSRLGIWGKGTPFREFGDFLRTVEKRGVGAMEMVAMEMKLRGMYIARQLSFYGVTFRIELAQLPDNFVKVYDESVKLWVEAYEKFVEACDILGDRMDGLCKKIIWSQFWGAHQRFFKYLCIAVKVPNAVKLAKEAVEDGKCVVIGLQMTGEARTLDELEKNDGELNDFVSTPKGVFQSLVDKHFPAPNKNRLHLFIKDPPKDSVAVDNDDPPVQWSKAASTHALANASDEDEDEEIKEVPLEVGGCVIKLQLSSVSNLPNCSSKTNKEPRRVVKNDIRKPNNHTDKKSVQEKIEYALFNLRDKANVKRLSEMKEALLEKIDKFANKLPCNTLDELVDQLGGSDIVAEMTGRKGRVVRTWDGAQYETRCYTDIALDQINIAEKDMFMDGLKDIAIISEAASSGISLQSDRRASNQKKRVHITLELPWSADRAIQQFGRTHRSNQVNAPECVFLISDLAGERRFASAVAKRLESLGALTHGDRRATDTRDLSRFNVDNKYGAVALTSTFKSILGIDKPPVPFPILEDRLFQEEITRALVGVGLLTKNSDRPGDVVLAKDHDNISKFLNRLLGVPVFLQNHLFNYYTAVLQSIIDKAKRSGTFDQGIKDLGAKGEEVTRVETHKFLREHNTGRANTELNVFEVVNGLKFEEACKILEAADRGPKEGFYMSRQIIAGKETALLAICMDDKYRKAPKKNDLYNVYRPHHGLTYPPTTLEELERKNRPISKMQAELPWKNQYEFCLNSCMHAYWRGNCKNRTLGIECQYGLRKRIYHVLTGLVLGVWSRIEQALIRNTSNSQMQILRLRMADGTKTIGASIPYAAVNDVIATLSDDAIKEEAPDSDDEPKSRQRSLRWLLGRPNVMYSDSEESSSSDLSDDFEVVPESIQRPDSLISFFSRDEKYEDEGCPSGSEPTGVKTASDEVGKDPHRSDGPFPPSFENSTSSALKRTAIEGHIGDSSNISDDVVNYPEENDQLVPVPSDEIITEIIFDLEDP